MTSHFVSRRRVTALSVAITAVVSSMAAARTPVSTPPAGETAQTVPAPALAAQTSNPTDAQTVDTLRAAAAKGDAPSMVALGSRHLTGRGLAADRLTGENQKTAEEARDRLAALMMPAQIAEAQKRVSKWLSQSR